MRGSARSPQEGHDPVDAAPPRDFGAANPAPSVPATAYANRKVLPDSMPAGVRILDVGAEISLNGGQRAQSTAPARMKTTFCPLALSLLAAAVLSGTAGAAAVSYTVNPALSSLTVSGSFQGLPFSAQAAGSMVDGYSGTIVGDLTGSTVTFGAGSSITALENPAPAFLPAGAGVDNYGVLVTLAGAQGAFRNIAIDFSGSVTAGSAPVASTLTFTAGALDYFAPPLNPQNGSVALTGGIASNVAPGSVTLTQAAGIETLTIPVSITYDIVGGSSQTFQGSIVATRVVPEPSLGILALTGLALIRRRRP